MPNAPIAPHRPAGVQHEVHVAGAPLLIEVRRDQLIQNCGVPRERYLHQHMRPEHCCIRLHGRRNRPAVGVGHEPSLGLVIAQKCHRLVERCPLAFVEQHQRVVGSDDAFLRVDQRQPGLLLRVELQKLRLVVDHALRARRVSQALLEGCGQPSGRIGEQHLALTEA
ncbi:hypothetical protein D3C72_1636230 [compost metagenome]